MEITTNQTIQVLDAICEKFGIAVDWTADNVIPYVQELSTRFVRYQLIRSILSIILILIAIGVFGYLTYFFCKKASKIDEYDDRKIYIQVAAGLVAIILITFLIIGMIEIVSSTERIILCTTFPEKLIIDYIVSFMS